MKKDFLDSIRCPICKHSNLKLCQELVNFLEIREGKIICDTCKASFPIKNGVIFLDQNIGQEALKERVALEKEIEKQNRLFDFYTKEWLLSFPFNQQLGIDKRTDRIVKLSATNSLMFLEKYNWLPETRILELGAGNCWLTAKLAENYKCVALDILTAFPKGLESADIFIKQTGIFFERVVADMKDLPFKDDSFDIVLINSALHHSPDLEMTLKEIYRILSPAGKLILLNEPSVGWFGGGERKKISQDRKHGINENRYTIQEWITSFKEAGFKYKIYLPSNLLDVLQTKGTILKLVSFLFKLTPLFLRRIIINKLGPLFLTIFDGFFNTIIYKN